MPFDIKAFYKENKGQEKQAQYVATDKFIDGATNKPIPWTIREISAAEDQALKDRFTTIEKDKRTGMRTEIFDDNKYVLGLAAWGVVEPDLEDSGLQNSYGVKSPIRLLQKMLSAGEIQKLALKVIELSGLDDIETKSDFEMEYEEAKKN